MISRFGWFDPQCGPDDVHWGHLLFVLLEPFLLLALRNAAGLCVVTHKTVVQEKAQELELLQQLANGQNPQVRPLPSCVPVGHAPRMLVRPAASLARALEAHRLCCAGSELRQQCMRIWFRAHDQLLLREAVTACMRLELMARLLLLADRVLCRLRCVVADLCT